MTFPHRPDVLRSGRRAPLSLGIVAPVRDLTPRLGLRRRTTTERSADESADIPSDGLGDLAGTTIVLALAVLVGTFTTTPLGSYLFMLLVRPGSR